ncbi:hypothetical protein H5410_000915 [Solanum commersonii]|uniref:Neprosin PEP catalytic domain-containing protein n=1 Tax=Solanum commersonii TaxID=4109 RepID=A0A9J6AXE5_SOLCO|nr:hypothetical protein H5410_000915 [Solanum commersonii]
MYIARDLESKDWWLVVSANQTIVGYWPNRIFSELNDFVSTVEWGGVVYSSPGVLEPPMGSSYFIAKDLKYDAHCSRIKIITDTGQVTDPGVVTMYNSNPDLYNVIHVPNH